MLAKIFLSVFLFFLVEGAHFHRKIHRAVPSHRRRDKDGCFIVKVRDGAHGRRAELFGNTTGKDGALHKHLNTFVKCSLRSGDVARLADDADVEYIEEDMVITLNEKQITGPEYWNLDRVDQADLPLDGSFTYEYTGEGVPIYIFDTGVNGAHEEFTGRMGEGIDLVTPGGDPNVDCHGHGTHVAGIAAGTRSGVAKRATIVSVRVMGCNRGGLASSVIAGIDWLISSNKPRGAIVMSFGSPPSQSLDDAVAKAVEKNFVVVVAAGNDDLNACGQSPAASPKAITVAATDIDDQRATYSNWGKCVDIFAPGSKILSASNETATNYTLKWGTSMAAPMVAGVAADYISWDASLSAEQITAILKNEATNGVVKEPKESPNLLLKISGTPKLASTRLSSTRSMLVKPRPLAPSNDLCVGAIELKCGTTVQGTTGSANFHATPGTCGAEHNSPEVWYSINVPAGKFTLSTCNNATFATKLTVWRGNCRDGNTGNLQCVVGTDDTQPQCAGGSALLNQTSSTAARYLVMVHGDVNQTGTFSLTLTCNTDSGIVPQSTETLGEGSSLATHPDSDREDNPLVETSITMPSSSLSFNASMASDSDGSAPLSPSSEQPDYHHEVYITLLSWSMNETIRSPPQQQNVMVPEASHIHTPAGSMYTSGLEDWGYHIGTQEQITSQSAADLSALAATIHNTKAMMYNEGFHAHVMTQQSANYVLSTPGNAAVTVAVADWGSGVTKAVVTSFIINALTQKQLHLTQNVASPILFACQVDCMDDDGHLLNSEPMALQVKISQNIPFTITLHSAEHPEGVDLAAAGGHSSHDNVCNCYTVHLPHTSLIVIRAAPQPTQKATSDLPQGHLSYTFLAVTIIAAILAGAFGFALYRMNRGAKPAEELVEVTSTVPLDLRSESALPLQIPTTQCH